jgi:hypothetical protein
MATYVQGGADLIDALGGGLPDESTKQWFAQHTQAVTQTLSATGQAFFERARTMYQTISESQALQMLRNLRNKMDDVWSGNKIQPLQTLAALQTAGPIMQRWVMAEPTLRARYLNQEVEGYGENYTNYHGDAVGESHFDYRRVMNGVVVVPEDDSKEFVLRHYYDPLSDDERELTLYEKIDILNTWDLVKSLLEEGGEDPTSQYGAML